MKKEANDPATRPEGKRPLTPAAERALVEAEQRRRQMVDTTRPKEVAGRGGVEPVRYGDWEVKGLATDF